MNPNDINYSQPNISNQNNTLGQINGSTTLRNDEDPLAKLISIVKKNNGSLDIKKVEKLFVISSKKVSHEMLQELVSQMYKNNVSEHDIIQVLLNLDLLAESGELENSFFTQAGIDIDIKD